MDDDLLQGVSDEAKSIYSQFYTKRDDEKVMRILGRASSTKATCNSIIDALSNPHPKTRYEIANVDGIPVPLLVQLVKFIPDRMMDYMLLHW